MRRARLLASLVVAALVAACTGAFIADAQQADTPGTLLDQALADIDARLDALEAEVFASTTTTTETPTTTTTEVPTTTAAPTTTTTAAPTTTTTTVPPAGDMPTPGNTGPRGTPHVFTGNVWVLPGWVEHFADARIEGNLFIQAGATVTLDHVHVTGATFIDVRRDVAPTPVRITGSRFDHALTIQAVTQQGNHDWSSPADADIIVQSSWMGHPPGQPGDHLEGLAGWGWPRGVQIIGSSITQDGPSNGTQTATTNWHGVDTLFDGCWFTWNGTPVAAYFTVYVEGSGNVVRNSWLEQGGGYVYPDSNPQATYVGNRDFDTGALLTLPD